METPKWIGRGDIVIFSNDPKPAHNHEQKGRRPWLVMSAEELFRAGGFVWAIPFTRTPRNYPMALDWSQLMPTSAIEGTLLCDQLTTVDLSARPFSFVEHVQVPSQVDYFVKAILLYN